MQIQFDIKSSMSSKKISLNSHIKSIPIMSQNVHLATTVMLIIIIDSRKDRMLLLWRFLTLSVASRCFSTLLCSSITNITLQIFTSIMSLYGVHSLHNICCIWLSCQQCDIAVSPGIVSATLTAAPFKLSQLVYVNAIPMRVGFNGFPTSKVSYHRRISTVG